jgi:hypothetical protein
MRDELAENLLAAVMHWDPEQVADVGAKVQALAHHKYDRYGQFRPGEKFLESLARWLYQLPNDSDRERALNFVLDRLVFIAGPELSHAIDVIYPDIIRPRLIARASSRIGCLEHCITKIVNSSEFKILQRRMLILGLSDGARLDLLRRACPELSHEQFWLTPGVGPDAQSQMVEKLEDALKHYQAKDINATFVEVVLVEDFSGSGATLIRPGDGRGQWKGKLAKAHDEIERLTSSGRVDSNARVLVLIYVASSFAEQKVRDALSKTGWGWDLRVIQKLPDDIVVTDPYIISLCQWFYDPVLDDEHKDKASLGYSGCALPLVLEHNTPNNSISLLWADTSDDPRSSLHRHALFPRYERHHKDRP